jgi:hypothetical protein
LGPIIPARSRVVLLLNAGQKAHVHLSSYLTTQEDERETERKRGRYERKIDKMRHKRFELTL